MTFFALVRREIQGSLPRLLIMSGLGGISNAALLASINSGAQSGNTGKVSLWAAALFVIALLIFVKTQHYILIVATAEIQAIIHRLRIRLMDDVRRAELVPLEAVGRARITSAITGETRMLEQASNSLAFAAQSLILIVFVAVYVAYQSILAFVLSALIIFLSGLVFHATAGQHAEGMRRVAEWENRLFDRLSDLLDGFKEVRLNQPRSEELYEDITEVSRTAANIKISTEADNFKRMIFSQSTLYILLAVIVFVVPSISHASGEALMKTTTALLFVVGACFGLVQSLPVITAANVAADAIEKLEEQISAARAAEPGRPVPPAERFGTVEMRDVVFRYVDLASESAFQVGPLNFTMRSGELIFIMGGNGSGKSTFMRLLAGLYSPASGQIILDGRPIVDSNRDSYRALISAVFSDFHLFRKLYGIPGPDPSEVEQLLVQFQLQEKTHLTDGEFQTLNLSSGQRRRLALIVTLLEKRPILLLDEWAADQDPEFRHKFYHELLPELNRAGVTVVVVTHDVRYVDELDIAARKLRMEEGRFVAQD